MPARFKTPTANGDILAVPDFTAIPKLVDANRRLLDRDDVRVGGLPLREMRALARRELQISDGPLVLAGHQPELSHPGVWAKNFALAGLARKLGGTGLNLIVDNDTVKHPSIRVPVIGNGPASVYLETVAFDRTTAEVPYETRTIEDERLFRSFPHRVAELTRNWGFEPLLARDWVPPFTKVAHNFTTMRQERERVWGCENHEVAVSKLTEKQAFRTFAGHILADLPRFREVYNASILTYRKANRIRSANHPAPELGPNEIPFWVRTPDGRRTRNTGEFRLQDLRPRALTLTLFARLCLGDFFIHGIGGGKYDEVTDAIIHDYFGVEPPAYQVLSATLHLPLPAFPTSAADLKAAERYARDLHWNPQRYTRSDDTDRRTLYTLLGEKSALAEHEPPRDHPARDDWFRRLQQVTQRLRPYVRDQLQDAEARLVRLRTEAAANAILQR
ncbi:MAG TPA: hypothetical protein VMZ71_09160, partial [Gemmataceae bacterium]|nr:hypothetical protein [Gemmataceae bacterium]